MDFTSLTGKPSTGREEPISEWLEIRDFLFSNMSMTARLNHSALVETRISGTFDQSSDKKIKITQAWI